MDNTSSPTSAYLYASLMGAGRAAFGLPFEHPLDTLKTRMQAAPGEANLWQIAKRVVQLQGVRGFYSGFFPNAVRVMSKQAYRYPMMFGFKRVYRQTLPAEWVTLATAVTIANFETFIICPLERMKVYLMTAEHKEKGVAEFFKKHRGHVFQEMTRGLSAVYFRQMTSWVTFLVTDDKVRDWERERIQSGKLPPLSQLKVSVIVGVINTVVILPLDGAKTRFQQAAPVNTRGLFDEIAKVYRTCGVRGLYAGFWPRLVQYTIQSAVTGPLLSELQKKFN